MATIWHGLFAMIVLVLAVRYVVSLVEVETIPYSRFESALKVGEIEEVVDDDDDSISGTFKARDATARQHHFETARVEPAIAAELAAAGVTYRGQSSGWLGSVVGWLLLSAIFLGSWMLLARRLDVDRGSGWMAISKSKARVFLEK